MQFVYHSNKKILPDFAHEVKKKSKKMEKEMEEELEKVMEKIIKMWKVVVFPDDEVSAVPCSWLIEIDGKIMCFWPEKNARMKRVKDENPPSSGNDKYKLYDCRVLFNGGKYFQ